MCLQRSSVKTAVYHHVFRVVECQVNADIEEVIGDWVLVRATVE